MGNQRLNLCPLAGVIVREFTQQRQVGFNNGARTPRTAFEPQLGRVAGQRASRPNYPAVRLFGIKLVERFHANDDIAA